MKKSMNVDNPFFAFMGRMCDVVIVNILFLVCSVPVFTMGAAEAAMYQTIQEMRRDQVSSVVRSYFGAFRRAFRKSFWAWLIQLLTGLLLVFDLTFVVRAGAGTVWHVMGMALGCLAFLWLLIACYLLPAGVYEGKRLKNAVAESLYLAVINFPRTVVMGILHITPAVCLMMGTYFMGVATPIYLTTGFGITAYWNTMLLEKCKRRETQNLQEE